MDILYVFEIKLQPKVKFYDSNLKLIYSEVKKTSIITYEIWN